MKFLSFLSAALLANAAALTVDQKLALLERAIPINRKTAENAGRRLDQGEEQIITAYDSIQFNSCVSLKTQLSEEMQEQIAYYQDLLSSWQSGEIVSQKSFVLFSICETDYCVYEAEDDLYMVDLDSWMGLTAYRPQKTMDYCEACQKSQNWCLYDQYQYEEAEAEDGGRKLKNNQVQYIDCDTCASMGCFEEENNGNNNNNNQNQITLEGMVEWVQGMSECQDTGIQWNNINLRAGFMCNEYGTGVEVAVFLDDECEVYTAAKSYADLGLNDAYAANSQSVVTYPFTNDINCMTDVEWESPENAQNQEEDQNDNNQEEEEPEVNEYCQELLNGDLLTPLDNCAYAGEQQEENNNNNQNEEENENAQYFYGYEYDLTDEQSDNAYAVCTAINLMQTEGASSSWRKNVAKKNVYNGNSGHLYDYSARTANNSKSGGGGGKAAGIIVGLLVACALAFVGYKQYSKKADSRKEPLVSEGMA